MADTTNLNAARAAKLGNQTPRERGQQKVDACLVWLYKWGWSSPEILRHVSGAAQPMAPRLVAAGLARKITLSSGGIAGRPNFAVVLTPDGLTQAMRSTELVAKYSDKIRETQLTHDLFAQTVTLALLQTKQISDYTPARLLEGQSGKIPDVTGFVTDAKGQTIRQFCIEIELEQKTGSKFDLFATRLIKYIQKNANRFVLIATDRDVVFNWYKKNFAEKSKLLLVEADGKGKIDGNKTKQLVIDHLLASRISVIKI